MPARPSVPAVRGGLYRIVLSPTHYYGGRSSNLKRRWKSHLQALQAGTHNNERMQAVFNLYGHFEPEVLIAAGPDVDLKAEEQRWLDGHFRQPGCVNLVGTSDGGCAGHTEATRRKMSVTRSSRPDLVEKARASIGKNRKPPSPEAVEALRARNRARTGEKRDPAVVEKIAAANFGRKNTPETLARMSVSASRRAATHPPAHGAATRALISAQQRGRVWVNDGRVNQRLPPEEAARRLETGWRPGRVPRSSCG
jgi:hypothetical protein